MAMLSGKKKPVPVNAVRHRDMSLNFGWEDLLEKGMATHSGILA